MLSRVGSMVAPVLGVGLVAGGHLSLALGVFGTLSALACLASLLLRFETTGRALGEGVPTGSALGAGAQWGRQWWSRPMPWRGRGRSPRAVPLSTLVATLEGPVAPAEASANPDRFTSGGADSGSSFPSPGRV
jgi:hypothetical protein